MIGKKYCRYCSFCILGDCYYCTAIGKVLKRIDKALDCDDFALSELGDVETGRQYQPRKPKEKSNTEQISLFAEKE